MAGIRDDIARQDTASPQSSVRVPAGFDDEVGFLDDMRSKYEWGFSFNEHNVIAGKEDAKFTVGNQWDPLVEARRKQQKKPVLTFNRLVAFMAQLVGNRLMNETEIRIFPDKAGTKPIADIREGLIRNIFKNSNADFAAMKPASTKSFAARAISRWRWFTRATTFSSKKSEFRQLPTLIQWCSTRWDRAER
jgi:hypothetical protein